MSVGPENEEGLPEDVVPVRSPVGAWHLAKFQAHRHLRDLATEASTRDAMSAAMSECWQAFIASMASSPEHQEDMATLGPPDEVYLDQSERIPIMRWNQRARSEHTDVWGFFKVRPTDEGAAPEVAVATPFRAVVLADLPSQTKVVSIHDPRHTAAAAVSEIIDSIYRDMDRTLRRYDPDEAWAALRSHASFLSVAARTALDQLPTDSFRDWERPKLTKCAFEAVAERVANVGLTTRAQQGLALHYVSRSYADAQERADDLESDPQKRSDRLLARIADMGAHAQKLLMAMNEGAVAAAGLKADVLTHSMMFIFRPIPASVPVLALIPDE